MAEDNDQKSSSGNLESASPPGTPEASETARGKVWHLLAGGNGSRRKTLLIVISALLIAAGLFYWWRSTYWEATDDAQVDGHINPISARVSGHVVRVNFDDNQLVKAGTVLVEIDPTDYRVAYERAKAEYADLLATANAAKVSVPITSVTTESGVATARARIENARAGVTAADKQYEAARARLREAEANNARAQTDLHRYERLVAKDVVSRQFYDHALAAAKSAAATVDAAAATATAAHQEVTRARGELEQAKAELRSAETAPQQVDVSKAKAESAAAAARRAKAALEQAELNLRYTKVVAPVDGITGRKSVEVGQNVEVGQFLLAIVPLEDIWVTANFKETQLRRMRPGQLARISVDAYKRTYTGHVESIGAASGSRFSLFPPENATGNYVKVVQRLPVRIRFDRGQDPEHLLRPGMSVVPRVRVR